MAARNDSPSPEQPDEPIRIDLDPETALRALLKVDPDAAPVDAGDTPNDELLAHDAE